MTAFGDIPAPVYWQKGNDSILNPRTIHIETQGRIFIDGPMFGPNNLTFREILANDSGLFM